MSDNENDGESLYLKQMARQAILSSLGLVFQAALRGLASWRNIKFIASKTF